MTKPKVLGVDPGTRIMGWGVYDGKHKTVGQIEAAPATLPVEQRLLQIYRQLDLIFREHRPTHVAFEAGFVPPEDKSEPGKPKRKASQKTAIALGWAQCLVFLLAAAYGCKPIKVYPSQAKKALTGSGRAEKKDVQRAAEMVGGFSRPLEPDEADGFAVTWAGWHIVEGNDDL